MSSFAVIGSGSWGTAFAKTLIDSGQEASLYVRDHILAEKIKNTKVNSKYLPEVSLENIKIIPDLNNISCEYLVLATPAAYFRETLRLIKNSKADFQEVIVLSKGIEQNTGLLLYKVVQEELKDISCYALSGPNFAHEIGEGLPAATVIAHQDQNKAEKLCNMVSNSYFRAYFSNEIEAVSVCGALKNIIAIACGIIYGYNLGENAKAALITRSIPEFTRIIEYFGCRNIAAVYGLAGIGDLMLTCSSQQSRNTSFGIRFAKGETIQEIQGSSKSIIEGLYTLKSIKELIDKENLDLPIANATYEMVYNNMDVKSVLSTLFARDIKGEV